MSPEILRCCGRLSLGSRRFLGARLGDLARWLRIRKRVAERNLCLAFPELSARERRHILRRHYQLLGAVFLDECALFGMSQTKIRQLLPLDEQLLDEQPTIYCAPHFVAAGNGGLRLSAALGARLMFHYKPMHNPFWERFYGDLRRQYGAIGTAATKPQAMRNCVRMLKDNKAIFYSPDIDPKHRKSMIFAPFLGVATAATTTSLSRLATMSGAKVRLLITVVAAHGYDVHLSPPLEDFPGDNLVADVCRINDLIAAKVREDPAQYYWLHRRFKTHPQGENRYA